MKGVYVLIVQVTSNTQVRIGSLGLIKFNEGQYAYVGSAQNNLEKRLKRHRRRRKKKFWHIDYLLSNRQTTIETIYWKDSSKPEECNIAAELAKHGSPINGFGSSDCDCKSHLFKILKHEFLKDKMTEIPSEPS